MTLLAAAGVMTEIVRLREAPGGYDDTGRWQPGEVTETTLLASVQPLGLADAETVGGAQLRDRRRVFVPDARPLGDLDDAPLVAAFSDREADRVRLAAGVFVVEFSESWPGHVEAVLLREP